jgi:hypothetical protein
MAKFDSLTNYYFIVSVGISSIARGEMWVVYYSYLGLALALA